MAEKQSTNSNAATSHSHRQTWAIFAFGVAFIVVVLVLVFSFNSLTTIQKFVLGVVLSLAAGGIGALTPGHLGFTSKIATAGGAAAFFLIVLTSFLQFVQAEPDPENPLVGAWVPVEDTNLDDVTYKVVIRRSEDNLTIEAWRRCGEDKGSDCHDLRVPVPIDETLGGEFSVRWKTSAGPIDRHFHFSEDHSRLTVSTDTDPLFEGDIADLSPQAIFRKR